MLIGISGKAQSGKNTVANMLSYLYYVDKINGLPINKPSYEEWNFNINFDTQGLQQHSFGENLKKCLSICLIEPLKCFEDIKFKNSKVSWLNITVRELLQKFGTAIRKEVSDTFWVSSLLLNYHKDDNWIITDVRFKSEAESILKRGGFLLRIEREGSGAGNHISETELDNYDKFNYVLNNNFKTLEELFETVKLVKKEIDLYYKQ